jgi:hypothetical protein
MPKDIIWPLKQLRNIGRVMIAARRRTAPADF